MLTYQIDSQNLQWSYVFGALEKSKQRLGIVDYSVSQTTLETVGKMFFVRSLLCILCRLSALKACH